MKNILFPTNLSKWSAQTLNYAIHLAGYYGSELTVFNVFQPYYGPRRPIIGEKSATDVAIENLRAFAKLHTEGNIYKSLNYKVRRGFTINSTIKETRSEVYDLLILSNRGTSDWLTRILGSKTSFISRRAHCPVLIVPTSLSFHAINNVLIAGKARGKGKDALENYLYKISSDHLMEKPTFINSSKENGKGDFHRNKDSITGSGLSGWSPFAFLKLKRKLEKKISEMNIDLLVLKLDESGLFLRQFGFRAWSQVILGLKVPTLVVNNRFVNSDRVRTTFPSLLRDIKLAAYA